MLRDTLLEGRLEATNHRFQKRPGKLWTHLSDGTLTKSQIDYILIRKKWQSSLKNTEACNSFSSIGSDHRVVICRLKLSLRKHKNLPRHARFDFNPLKTDNQLQANYAVEVSNRYSLLLSQDLEQNDSPTAKYCKFVDAVNGTNKALLPPRPRKHFDDPTADPRVVTARTNLFKAKEKYHLDPSEATRSAVAGKKDILASCYNTVEEEILKKKIRGAEMAANRCKNKESWNLVNDITGRKKANCGRIEGGNAEGRLKAWKDHFSNLLGQPPKVPDEQMKINTIHPELNN